MTQELVTIGEARFLPALTTDQAAQRFNSLVRFVNTVMRSGIDYGVIPGTGQKPTLLKPGAEKLTTLFGLSVRFVLVKECEDWAGETGEPFFYYLYRCQLWRGDLLIAEADGSCNSRESKYRWREAKRTCPACGQAAIIKGKQEYGGGWLCFKKQGGCGAKYSSGDQAIEGQPAGRVPNPDIFDQVNTIQKMAEKRALIAAVLIGCNASEFFTQDVEDIPLAGNGATYQPTIADPHTGEILSDRDPSFRPAVARASIAALPGATMEDIAAAADLDDRDLLRDLYREVKGRANAAPVAKVRMQEAELPL